VRDPESYAARRKAAVCDLFLKFAGGDRICSQWVDPYIRDAPTVEEVGRRLLESIVRATALAIDNARADPSLIDGALGRELRPREREAAERLFAELGRGILAPIAAVIGNGVSEQEHIALNPDDEKHTWLAIGSRVPRDPMPAIIYLSMTIGPEVFPLAPHTVVQPGEDYFAALRDARRGLPPLLAVKFTAGERLMAHKLLVESEADYFDSGIEAPGTTELDRRGFPYLFADGKKKSVLVLAPTSGGKSRFGQLALIQTVLDKKREVADAFGGVVVLVPTKALVDQVSREIRQTLAETEASQWVVLEGSRDFPQNDESIRTGRFDISVIIPEKLAALVRAGMNPERLPLLLVDELQHIVDGQRGLKLESLLLDVFRRESVPRFVGLSASLAPDTIELLGSWFSRNGLELDILEIDSRPVPLTVSVVDDYRRISSRTHERDDRTLEHRRLPDLPSVVGSSQLRQTAKDFRRSLSLVMELLAPHVLDGKFRAEAPSILVFVSSKKIAESLADACRELFVRHLGLDPVELASIERPLRGYRFPPFAENDEAKDPTETLRLLAPTPVRHQLVDALATGVGFHSASLTAVGREIIESLFRQGVVRVLFATDTLRLGINLPADVVVNGDLIAYTGDANPRFVDKDVLLQRLGRAGRLLHSRGGQGLGYLVTPEKIPDSVRHQIDERAAEMLTGRKRASWEDVKRAATDDASLFKAFVADWSGGAQYSTPGDDHWFEDLLLQHLEYLPGRTFSEGSLDSETSALFARTIAGVAGDRMPRRAIESLQDIGAIRVVAGEVRLTDAGRATALNALGVSDLPVIEEVAAEAVQGAGPLTLLYIACTSEFIGRSSQHLGVRPSSSANVLEEMLGHVSKAYQASRNPGSRGTFMRHFPEAIADAIGRGDAAEELRSLLAVDSARGASDVQLTALWRAFNVYLRWIGAPYRQIAELRNPSGSMVPEVALDSLAGNVAYFLSAASDLLGSSPSTMHFRTLSYFAAEVELGLPASLSPLVRLNRPSLNRERLLGLARLLGRSESQWDGLSELFDLYLEKQSELSPEDGWHPLPPSEIAWISDQLSALDERRRSAAYSVAPDIEMLMVPGLDGHRVSDVLHQIPQGNGPQILAAMLAPFTVEPHYDPANRAVRIDLIAPNDQLHRTFFYFPDHVVSNAYLDSVSTRLGENENALVVAVEGATFGATDRGRYLQESCAIINPSLLVELVARLYARNSVEVSSGDGDDPLFEIFGTTEPPALDVGTARRELSRVLLHNAPMLNRTDLENRLAFADLAPPARQ
jgi:superfamily II DNA/RNA helicase